MHDPGNGIVANFSSITWLIIYPDIYSDYTPSFRIEAHNGITSPIMSQYHYKLMESYHRFLRVQYKNYNMECIRDLEFSLSELDEIYYSSIYGSIYRGDERGLIQEIRARIAKHKRVLFLQTRKVNSVLGKFYDSLSPQMIHKILTWLKEDNPTKFGKIKRGPKEDILYNLHKLDVKIDGNFCCKFIDQVNPVLFLKEFGVKLFKNGKRQKNTVLRELLKEQIYNREKNYLRYAYITPELRGLPENVENNILSFLIS